MAEEKPFEATQSRLDRAKREGDIARSPEIGAVAAFGAGLFGLCAVLRPLSDCARIALSDAASGRSASAPLAQSLLYMLVPAACAAAAALTTGVLQAGGIRLSGIRFKLERLSPAENFKRMISRESAITAVRATVAFLCAGAALLPAFAAIFARTLHASGVSALAQSAWSGSLRAAGAACAVGALFAVADYGMQFARWRKRLRMSFEELKRDRKEHDGDPLARGRRRALHRRIARGSLQRVKDAAFVVTNPTHLAIALEYKPPSVPVPRVLVRAADDAAQRVRSLAAQYGVPVVENVPLARLLFAKSEPGEVIPEASYLAVAEIVAALSKTSA